MSMLERAPEIAGLDVRILATDIDANVVNFSRAGIYSNQDLNGVAARLRKKYFDPKNGPNGEVFQTKPVLRKMVQFNQLNLLGPWPMKGKFDVIFCRNVVIYFDPETQERLWPRFRKQLTEDGILFLGHSERIATTESCGFKVAGPTTYSLL